MMSSSGSIGAGHAGQGEGGPDKTKKCEVPRRRTLPRGSLARRGVADKLVWWARGLFSTALFGVPLSLPTPQGRRARQLKARPDCWI